MGGEREQQARSGPSQVPAQRAPAATPHAAVLALQSRAGNAAVTALARGGVLARNPRRGATDLRQTDLDFLGAGDTEVMNDLVEGAQMADARSDYSRAVGLYQRHEYLSAAREFARIYAPNDQARRTLAWNACQAYVKHERDSARSRRPSTARRPRRPDPRQIAEARRHFDAGAQAFQSRDYGRAIEQWLRADAIIPTSDMQWNLAQAYRRLGRRTDAADAMRRYESMRQGASASGGRRRQAQGGGAAGRQGADLDLSSLDASDAEVNEGLVRDAEMADARSAFTAATQAFGRGDFGQAAEQFGAARGVGGNELLYNQGLALFRGDRPLEALPLLQRYFGD